MIVNRTILTLTTGCLILLAAASCKKNNNAKAGSALTLSLSTVKRGEPLVATANTANAAWAVKWSVNPSLPNTWISATGNKSVMVFSNSGSYRITANYFPDSSSNTAVDSSSSPVIVSDSLYNDTTVQCNVLVQVPISSGDQLTLMPVGYNDTGLAFLARTQFTYGNQYPILDFAMGPDTTAGFEFVFGPITERPCGNSTNLPTPAIAVMSLSGMSNGTSPFKVDFGGNLFRGSLTVTDSSCSFTWSYTSGVVISPLTISKQ